MANPKERICVDGEAYVLERTVIPPATKNYVLVRTFSAGVFAGELESRTGKEVVLSQARRIWYWEGAASLSQLAVEGTCYPSKCKFPVAVPKITLTEAIEIIPCTERAQKSIASVPVWRK